MRRLRQMLARFGQSERGAAAVEFALVCMPLVLLSVGVVEFGRAFNVQNDLAYAADVGTRAMLVHKDISPAQVESAIREAFTGGTSSDLETHFGTEIVGERTFRTITLVYPLSLGVPGLTSKTFSLSVERRLPM